jgi:hypothetical protein
MRSIVVDAGPLIALVDRRDRHHARAQTFFAGNRLPLVSNWLVLGEAFHALCDQHAAARNFLDWATRSLMIDEETRLDRERILAILERCADLPADLTDASLLALCERRGFDEIASFDSDFAVYRTKARRALRNVL